jgi:hypothetical protein
VTATRMEIGHLYLLKNMACISNNTRGGYGVRYLVARKEELEDVSTRAAHDGNAARRVANPCMYRSIKPRRILWGPS